MESVISAMGSNTIFYKLKTGIIKANNLKINQNNIQPLLIVAACSFSQKWHTVYCKIALEFYHQKNFSYIKMGKKT